MPFTNGNADAEQLANMTEAVETYCRARGIVDETAREHVGRLVFSHFESGLRTSGELKARLERLRLVSRSHELF
jgi:hypothetical protein